MAQRSKCESPIGIRLAGFAHRHQGHDRDGPLGVATPDTVFRGKPRFAFGIVLGDGVHSLWPDVIGSVRGRTFLLTRQILGAGEAKSLGVVSEIVERKDLMRRAREIAREDGLIAALQ
jgi:enoyl-CoA hydratase/carnithine racemase